MKYNLCSLVTICLLVIATSTLLYAQPSEHKAALQAID